VTQSGLPTGVDVKLFNWIKGAVTFTKAPAGPKTAQTPEPSAPPPPRIEISVVAPLEPPREHESEAQLATEPLAHEGADEEPPTSAEPPAAIVAPPEPANDVAPEPDVSVEPPIRITVDAGGPPTQDEIERRRGLVRKFFNDYWSSIDDKPASFAERLDDAEGYINERVAAGGEPWQLDPATRKQLGLPPSRKR
jgi:hypothetical protein